MKTITKIILVVLCIGFFTCVNHEAKRNNPFDPGGPGYLYYSLMTSGFSSSGSSYPYGGTGTGTSTGTGTGNSGKPDLVISSCTVPSSTYTSGETGILRGATISITCTIQNQGDASTGSNGIYNGVYLSTNSTVDTSDTYLFYNFYSSKIGPGHLLRLL